MTRFEICLDRVLGHEGGYVDHPADPGGATNMGVTRRALADWRGVEPWWRLEKAQVRDLSRAEANELYRVRYWQVCGADRVPDGLDHALFDFAVNSGPARAVRELQALLAVPQDGIFGSVTADGVARHCDRHGAGALIEALCVARVAFLEGLTTYRHFGRGWKRRVEAVRRAALTDARSPVSHDKGQEPMTVLEGYRTYIVAAAMLVAGIAQLAGVDLPGFEDRSAVQLVMEALAVIFLRKGIKRVAPQTGR